MLKLTGNLMNMPQVTDKGLEAFGKGLEALPKIVDSWNVTIGVGIVGALVAYKIGVGLYHEWKSFGSVQHEVHGEFHSKGSLPQ